NQNGNQSSVKKNRNNYGLFRLVLQFAAGFDQCILKHSRPPFPTFNTLAKNADRVGETLLNAAVLCSSIQEPQELRRLPGCVRCWNRIELYIKRLHRCQRDVSRILPFTVLPFTARGVLIAVTGRGVAATGVAAFAPRKFI